MPRHSPRLVYSEVATEAGRARYLARHLPDSWLGPADPAALEQTSLEEDLVGVVKPNRQGETRSAIALLAAVIARLADQRSTGKESC